MNQITFLLDITTSYVSFGLALYAIGAIVALVWMRKRKAEASADGSVDLLRAGGCVIALVMLEVVRQFCDSLHYQHFPPWLTRAALPGLYFILGNSLFRLTKANVIEKAPPLISKEAGRSAS